MKLEEEGGITEISLNNAKKLIERHGKPGQLYFKADRKSGEYFVTAFWSKTVKHIFTGFGWGYPGTGPAGLLQFLQMCGQSEVEAKNIIRITEGRMENDKYHKTDASLSLNEDFLKKYGYL